MSWSRLETDAMIARVRDSLGSWMRLCKQNVDISSTKRISNKPKAAVVANSEEGGRRCVSLKWRNRATRALLHVDVDPRESEMLCRCAPSVL